MCVRAAAARPGVAREALLTGSRQALRALLALPERAAPALLPDAEVNHTHTHTHTLLALHYVMTL